MRVARPRYSPIFVDAPSQFKPTKRSINEEMPTLLNACSFESFKPIPSAALTSSTLRYFIFGDPLFRNKTYINYFSDTLERIISLSLSHTLHKAQPIGVFFTTAV